MILITKDERSRAIAELVTDLDQSFTMATIDAKDWGICVTDLNPQEFGELVGVLADRDGWFVMYLNASHVHVIYKPDAAECTKQFVIYVL